MINYLFYRFSRIATNQPTYWAKIIVSSVLLIALLPTGLSLAKYFFGCYDQNENDGAIKLFISAGAILATVAANFYYSPHRVKAINYRYSAESKTRGNLKLMLMLLLLILIFWFGSGLVGYFLKIPEC